MQARKKRSRRPKPLPPDGLRLVYTDASCPTRPEDFAVTDASSGRAAVTADSVLRYIALHQGVNSPALARFFVKTMKTIARFTTELRYRGFIEFRGSLNKGGYFLMPAGLRYLEHPEETETFAPTRMTADLVLNFIRKHPGANHYAIAAEFKRTIKSVSRHTHRLRSRNKIEFRGTPRDGGFFVLC